MAAARHLATVHSLKPNNPFPMEAYSRPSFVHYKYKYSPRSLSVGEYLFPRVDNWFSRSRLRPLVLLGSSDDRYNSGVEEDELVPRISYSQFKRQLKIWAHNQYLPVAVAGYLFYYGLEGFLLGYVCLSFMQLIIPLGSVLHDNKEVQELFAASVPEGEYNLLLLSNFLLRLTGAQFYAIFIACTTTISYVFERLGVKIPFELEELTKGFGVGIIFSLVTGFGSPKNITTVGVTFALANVSLVIINLKIFGGGPNPFHIEIHENEEVTDGYVTIILKYLFSRIYYFIRRGGDNMKRGVAPVTPQLTTCSGKSI